MTKRAEAVVKTAKRRPVTARPKPETDRTSLRAKINKHFSKSLEHLSR
jgi:hypothetical protein